MAWSVLVGTTSTGTGAVTPAPNASHASGDIEYLLVENSGEAAVALTTAAGFASVSGGQANAGGTGPGTAVADIDLFWRRWNGSDGNPTITDVGNHLQAVIVSVRGGLASGTPHEAVTASSETGNSDTSGSATGGTSTVNGCLILVAVATALPDALAEAATHISSWANSNLTSVTERKDSTTDSGNGGGLACATGEQASAGAWGATTYTTSVNTAKAMVALAIMPASGDNRDASIVLTGGGAIASSGQKGGQRAQALTGGGVIASAGQKGGQLAQALTGGGVLIIAGAGPDPEVAIVLTGGGVLTVVGSKGATVATPLTGGGAASSPARKGATRSDQLTAGGVLQLLTSTSRFASVNLTGGGVMILAGGNDVAMTDLGAIMQAIADALEAPGRPAYAYPADDVKVPCVVVGYPGEIEYDIAYQRGADLATFPVYFLTGRVVERAARDELAAVVAAGSGIKDTLDGLTGAPWDTLRVTTMRILNVQVAGIDYLAAQFNAEVVQ